MTPETSNILIRRAAITDIPTIARIINDAAEYGLMLHRSLEFLYEHVRDFHVAVTKEEDANSSGESGGVVGVCGLSIVWADLAEVYSLVLSPKYRGLGLGKKLVLACVQEAGQLGIRKLMTLTYEQAFFARCGFQVIDRMELPLKVWSDCIRCPKNKACDEIAMIRILADVPESLVPTPTLSPERYEVPVLLRITHPPLPPLPPSLPSSPLSPPSSPPAHSST